MDDGITKIYNQLTVKVSDCFLMVFCKSMLFLFATSRDSSNSVIWICNFFFTRCTSVFNFVSASTTRAFSCSISILVCLLIYFISYLNIPYDDHRFNRFLKGFTTVYYCFQVTTPRFSKLSKDTTPFVRWYYLSCEERSSRRWAFKVNMFRDIWHFTSNVFSNETSIRLPRYFSCFAYFDTGLAWMFRCMVSLATGGINIYIITSGKCIYVTRKMRLIIYIFQSFSFDAWRKMMIISIVYNLEYEFSTVLNKI